MAKWLLFLVACLPAWAQEAGTAEVTPSQQSTMTAQAQQPGPAHPPDAASTQAKKRKSKAVESVLLSSETWQPLSPYQKFRLFTDDLVNPGTHLALAGGAWVSWSTNDQSYMGPGAEGWAKRYGYSVADEAVGQFTGAFALPVIFKQDPRYIPLDQGSKKWRVAYAMSRVLFTRGDNGKPAFNVSKVGTTFILSSVSNLYYPSGRDSSVGATFGRAGFSLATDAGYNVFVEFWPEITRKLHLGPFFQQLVRRTVRVPGTTY
jgi:hypothetical protein